MKRISRRSLLAGGGLAGALLPFLHGSFEREAHADAGRLERFVAIYMPHGVAKELCRPGPDFDLRNVATSLAPFDDPAKRSLRDQLLVIEGLDLTTGVLGGTAGHDGSRVILTGSAGNGVNASLDQYLAVERGLGSATPLASLVLGVGNPRPDLGQCISYAAGGGALPKIVNPSESFREIFGKRLAGQDPVALARMDIERRRGQSMIDALRADLSSLSLRVDARDRAKLDQHLTALRELEKGIAKFELTCTPPPAPNDAQFSKVLAYGGGEPYFETITNLQIDLLVAAFACGVTRFATLFLADLSRTRLDRALPDDVHTNVAHRYAASGDDGTHTGQPSTWEMLGRQNRYCYGKVARLATSSPTAHSDTTLVMASSDMGDPARHSSRQVPTILLGGGATFRLGRYLDVRKDGHGVPNNWLLVSIARAFGINVEAYGESPDPNVTRGELSSLG